MVRIENNRRVNGFFDACHPDMVNDLLGNNKDKFHEVLGPHNGTYRSEFLHYIWILTFEDRTFHVLTGKRGTSYETLLEGHNPLFDQPWASFVKDEEMGKICVRFLEYVYNLLKS